MLFALSKSLAFLVQPSSLAFLALLLGLWMTRSWRCPRLASRLAWGGASFLIIGGLLPVGNALVLPLEQRFAGLPQPDPADGYYGIILLGGFEDGWVSAGREQLHVNESAERLTEGLRLAKRLPETKIVFTGGVGGRGLPGREGAEAVSGFLREMGIAGERIVLEGAARNTHENALLTSEMLAPEPSQRWLLVTSAYHMPRAMGLFRKAGFNVTAHPVDYRTRGAEDLARPFSRIPAGLQRLDLAASEWMGLLLYYLTGRIDEAFPAP